MASGSGSWLPVDEPNALSLETAQLGDELFDPKGDVVKPGSASFEEAADGGVGCEGLQELDGADEGDADAQRLQPFGRGTGIAAQEFEESTTFFDGTYGDGHVVQWSIGRGRIHHHERACAGTVRVASMPHDATACPYTLQGEPRWQMT